MKELTKEINIKPIQVNGKGLFSKNEVNVSICSGKNGSGIVFLLKDKKIPAQVKYVSNTGRNTVLTNEGESICLVEHFLSACSLHNISDIEVSTNENELIFDDGSGMFWHKLFLDLHLKNKIEKKYELKKPIFIKKNDKIISAIPHNGFQISYKMDYDHPALGKLFAEWKEEDGIEKILRARTFAKKEENDFFGVTDRLLTLTEKEFNKPLYEPLEPGYHKILDIIGDLRLSGINPLEINMHVFAYKSGHELNIELAKELSSLSW